jgi:glucokinase
LEILIQATETKDSALFEQTIGEAIQTFKTKATNLRADLLGIGIGVSSFVHADGLVDSTYGFVDFMEDYPLAQIMEAQHALPCRIDNDARLVALGEAVYGRGRDFERVLVLTLGTGLGLGFVVNQQLDGKLPFGHMGGHMSILQNGVTCYCGKTGCLESLVSATGILAAAERSNWPAQNPELPFTVESIFQASAVGNAGAGWHVACFIRGAPAGRSPAASARAAVSKPCPVTSFRPSDLTMSAHRCNMPNSPPWSRRLVSGSSASTSSGARTMRMAAAAPIVFAMRSGAA